MSRQYLGFPISEELHQRIQKLEKEVQAADNKRPYALQIFQVVSDLSDAGLQYFFIESLKRAKIGKIKLMAVENAIKVGKRAILTVGKQILKAMSSEQIGIIMEVMTESLVIKEEQV